MHDEYMRVYFDNNIECTQVVLRTILEMPDLIVESVTKQAPMDNLSGRAVVLDILAKDSQGKRFDIEIQNSNRGAEIERAMYHLSIINTNALKKDTSFKELPAVYVIFITKNDVRRGKRPIYKYGLSDFDTGEKVPLEQYIVYVNGSNKDTSTALGRLIHDFYCTKADEMYNKELADRTRYLKESKEGQRDMTDIIEEFKNECRLEGLNEGRQEALKERNKMISALLKDGMSMKKMSDMFKIPLEEIDAIKNNMSNEEEENK